MITKEKDTINSKSFVIVQTKDTIYEFSYDRYNCYDYELDSSYIQTVLKRPTKYLLKKEKSIIYIKGFSSYLPEYSDTIKTYLSFVPGTCTQDEILRAGPYYYRYHDKYLSHPFLCYESDTLINIEGKINNCHLFANHSPLGQRKKIGFTADGIPLYYEFWYNGSNWRIDQNQDYSLGKNDIQLVNARFSVIGNWDCPKSVSYVYKITKHRLNNLTYPEIEKLVKEHATYYQSKYLRE